jgi:hypothetical protein
MERRLSPRRYLQLNIQLEIPSHSQSLPASLMNISIRGAFIETDAPLSLSTPLIIVFKLLSGADFQHSFRLYARVIRRAHTGVGVAFLPMPAGVTDALHAALSLHEQQFAIRP